MNKLISITSTIFIGASVGWIMGLSDSPVVSTIIASIMSLGFGAIAVVSGFEQRAYGLLHIAIFCLSLIISGTIGLNYKPDMSRCQIEKEIIFWKKIRKEGDSGDSLDKAIAIDIYNQNFTKIDSIKNEVPAKKQSEERTRPGFKNDSDNRDFQQISDQAGLLLAFFNKGQEIPSHIRDQNFPFLISLIDDPMVNKDTKVTILTMLHQMKSK